MTDFITWEQKKSRKFVTPSEDLTRDLWAFWSDALLSEITLHYLWVWDFKILIEFLNLI